MKIFVCSKLKGNINNIKRARDFSRSVILQGHFPLTPHIYFTLFLDDLIEEEREIGMNAGLEWLKECDEVWVFDKEKSEGMKKEIECAKKLNKPIIEKWNTSYQSNINLQRKKVKQWEKQPGNL